MYICIKAIDKIYIQKIIILSPSVIFVVGEYNEGVAFTILPYKNHHPCLQANRTSTSTSSLESNCSMALLNIISYVEM